LPCSSTFKITVASYEDEETMSIRGPEIRGIFSPTSNMMLSNTIRITNTPISITTNAATAGAARIFVSWSSRCRGVTRPWDLCRPSDRHICSGMALQLRRRVGRWRAGLRWGYSLFMWSTMLTSACSRSASLALAFSMPSSVLQNILYLLFLT